MKSEQYITEIDQIFDDISPEQINLKSFDSKDKLCPAIWKAGKLKPIIRRQLRKIAVDFMKQFDFDVIIDDIVIIGSIAGYNWSKYSDVDLHVLVDFAALEANGVGSKNVISSVFYGAKNEWNEDHDINIYGYEVEIFVQDSAEDAASDGIYSVLRDRWVKIPHGGTVITQKELIRTQSAAYINRIDEIDDELSGGKITRGRLNAIDDELNRMFNEIVQGRRRGLDEYGEGAPGNIIFKVLRRTGHMATLNTLRHRVYDALNSVR